MNNSMQSLFLKSSPLYLKKLFPVLFFPDMITNWNSTYQLPRKSYTNHQVKQLGIITTPHIKIRHWPHSFCLTYLKQGDIILKYLLTLYLLSHIIWHHPCFRDTIWQPSELPIPRWWLSHLVALRKQPSQFIQSGYHASLPYTPNTYLNLLPIICPHVTNQHSALKDQYPQNNWHPLALKTAGFLPNINCRSSLSISTKLTFSSGFRN